MLQNIENLLDHQQNCLEKINSTSCFCCGINVNNLETHECRYEEIQPSTFLCFLCVHQIPTEITANHVTDCLSHLEERFIIKATENINETIKSNTNVFNKIINNCMLSLSNSNKQIAQLSSLVTCKNKEFENHVKSSTEYLTNLINEKNEEIANLKSLVCDMKISKENFPITDNQIIKCDQMDLRLLSNEPFYSDPAYTTDGYFYRIKMYGYEIAEKKMAIYFQLLQSPHDHVLKWPFKRRVIVTLRNNGHEMKKEISFGNYNQGQLENAGYCRYFYQPVHEYNPAIGYTEFINHEHLKNFIVNNMLFINVSIENHI
ncbi:TNF receptor-associated factor 4-like [Hydra vulgaris]|uniref:TNF receptor-associated factor 4-like n=1 Tax=Hydra vulgaris TaxID=6087 RepID=A0ABM4B729_HYDVU